jgi:hypothetical protein
MDRVRSGKRPAAHRRRRGTCQRLARRRCHTHLPPRAQFLHQNSRRGIGDIPRIQMRAHPTCLLRVITKHTGAGGDNGIDHNKNWLRFPYASEFSRSHDLHPHPYQLSKSQGILSQVRDSGRGTDAAELVPPRRCRTERAAVWCLYAWAVPPPPSPPPPPPPRTLVHLLAPDCHAAPAPAPPPPRPAALPAPRSGSAARLTRCSSAARAWQTGRAAPTTRAQLFNDAPCPPCTSYGASIRQPLHQGPGMA